MAEEDLSHQYNRAKKLEGKERAEFLASLPTDIRAEIERLFSEQFRRSGQN